ncbi:hypothetical protein D9619_001480 [Psilocybe cf. subviscida]|uniref:Uncharacterized protein n=1 Tax=Psilocybe cf. subviscida TaxID=2480587 RepID=A0A8H5BEC1_9AGAR|nr:hypothetical protein D9619_001480 [Psilocybe cf. subviscida]
MPLLKRNHNEPAPQPEPPRKKGGLFSSNSRDVDDTRQSDAPTRKKSIFSGRSGSSSPPTNHTNVNDSGSGFFRRRRSSTSSTDSDGQGSGLFGRGGGNKAVRKDPTVRAAHQMVADAENAEREADRALEEARQRVKLAREHAQHLEKEAIEDARRAKAKQAEAKMVSKSAKGLGRHG